MLESITREEAKQLIESYGGRVTTSISGKTSYLVKGELEVGESKLKKALSLRLALLSEDALFDLIETRAENTHGGQKERANHQSRAKNH